MVLTFLHCGELKSSGSVVVFIFEFSSNKSPLVGVALESLEIKLLSSSSIFDLFSSLLDLFSSLLGLFLSLLGLFSLSLDLFSSLFDLTLNSDVGVVYSSVASVVSLILKYR